MILDWFLDDLPLVLVTLLPLIIEGYICLRGQVVRTRGRVWKEEDEEKGSENGPPALPQKIKFNTPEDYNRFECVFECKSVCAPYQL